MYHYNALAGLPFSLSKHVSITLVDTLARFGSQTNKVYPCTLCKPSVLFLGEWAVVFKGEGSVKPQAEPQRGWHAWFTGTECMVGKGFSILKTSFNSTPQAKLGLSIQTIK